MFWIAQIRNPSTPQAARCTKESSRRLCWGTCFPSSLHIFNIGTSSEDPQNDLKSGKSLKIVNRRRWRGGGETPHPLLLPPDPPGGHGAKREFGFEGLRQIFFLHTACQNKSPNQRFLKEILWRTWGVRFSTLVFNFDVVHSKTFRGQEGLTPTSKKNFRTKWHEQNSYFPLPCE